MMTTTAPDTSSCPYCGMIHNTICHLIKAVKYYPDGTIKRIELKSPVDYLPSQQNPAIRGPIWSCYNESNRSNS